MMRAMTAAALCALSALLLYCVLHTPDAWSPARIAVTLAPGQSIVLGQQELAAPHADRRHLVLGRETDGSWWATNANPARQVMLQLGQTEQRIGSTHLAEGQQLRIGATLFKVSHAGPSAFTIETPAHTWRYDGATLWRDGRVQPSCPDTRLPGRLSAAWNRVAPLPLTIPRPMRIGGNLQCDNRLGLAGLELGAASASRQDGQLTFSASAGNDGGIPVLVDGADLATTRQPLENATLLGIGRTRYRLQFEADRVILAPTRAVALFAEAAHQLPQQVSWTWRLRENWTLPAGAPVLACLVLAGLCACAAALAWQHGRWPFVREVAWPRRAALAGNLLLVLAGACFLLLQRSGQAPGVGCFIVLAIAALWCCLLQPGSFGLATAAALLLLAVGVLSQLELGLGGGDTSMLRHVQKTSALLAIGGGASCALRLWLAGRKLVVPQTRLEWMLAALAAVALFGLLMEVLFGDETGVFDIQPVEFAKLALACLTAHCIAVGLGWRGGTSDQPGRAWRWLRVVAPVLLFLALLGLALVQVDDYSPLVLLMVWGMVMGLAYALAARKLLLGAALIAVALSATGAIAIAHVAGSAAFANLGFYGDRFLVWLDPGSHPHTGQQLLLGARAIAEGGWLGLDGRLGLASMGQAAGSVLHVPAVQDDFAPSFFLNRHGLSAALALWLLQSLFLTGVMMQAAQSWAASGQARDFRHAWLGRFRCFALCGLGAFLLGHLMLSWGTNLAIFPIMGQPMSFLSAGGSHLLFFICPLLGLCAIRPHSLEE